MRFDEPKFRQQRLASENMRIQVIILGTIQTHYRIPFFEERDRLHFCNTLYGRRYCYIVQIGA
jgi:hypothetical protein